MRLRGLGSRTGQEDMARRHAVTEIDGVWGVGVNCKTVLDQFNRQLRITIDYAVCLIEI